MLNSKLQVGSIKKNAGFTLIELMVVIMVIAILAAIAIPSYQQYVRRATNSQVEQEIQRISMELERYKSRNFNYKNFSVTTNRLPTGYTLDLMDGTDATKTLATGIGQKWVMKVSTTDARLYSFLLNSSGFKCKNKTEANIDIATASCGTGVEQW